MSTSVRGVGRVLACAIVALSCSSESGSPAAKETGDSGPGATGGAAGSSSGSGGTLGTGGSASGGTAPSDGGAPASGGAGNESGGSGGAAARSFPTDRSAFGLGDASRCIGADVLFCEDFEGDAIDTAKWDVQTWGSGSATIDSARAARGKHSVHVTQPTDVSRVMLRETQTFAKTGNHFFGRFFLYLDRTLDPLSCPGGTCTNLVHYTIASAGGDYVDGGKTYRPDVRAVGAVNQNLLVNLDGGPKPEVGVSDDGKIPGYGGVDASHRDQWMCFEFEYAGEGDTGEVRVYWDGIEHPALHYSTQNRGDKGELWPIPKYDYVEFGLAHYQTDPTVSSFDAWIDEVAVDDQRIGCAL
ncbi:MAG TPA: hypothetical protein VHE30_15990 [Polyangiaceae bacterium]|nr:hypothetical protein [Polyangiaceae bacterium]